MSVVSFRLTLPPWVYGSPQSGINVPYEQGVDQPAIPKENITPAGRQSRQSMVSFWSVFGQEGSRMGLWRRAPLWYNPGVLGKAPHYTPERHKAVRGGS